MDMNEIRSKLMDTVLLDTSLVYKISKILLESLMEPVKKAIVEYITEMVKETIQYGLNDGADKLQHKYEDLIHNLGEQEQFCRRNCLFVFVPEKRDEDKIRVVCDIFRTKLRK